VGRALTRKLAEVLQNRGFKSLLVWVLEGNPSMGFYERLGGVRETRRVIHLGGKDLPECSYGWPKMEELA
jgi:ribosomal protein S18 acetylase RimI-like enzyme